MFFLSLKYDTADVVRHCYANHAKQSFGITANTFSVQSLRCHHGFCQFVQFFLGCQIATLLLHHIFHQLVSDAVHCNDFFFCNTRQVVVEGTSVDDILCCLSDICGFIHQCRRITCTCTDSSLSGGKHCSYYTGTTGCCNQRDIRVLHHNVAGFQCRLHHGTCHIVRATGFNGSLIHQIQCKYRCFDCLGMGVKYYCVSRRYHTDGITDNGFTGIGTRGNRTDYSKGAHLYQGKTSVTGPCGGM